MPFVITLPDGYGYCVAIALGLFPILSFAQGNVVGMKRRAAGIPYPNAYATHDQAKNNRAAFEFNCAQRAHYQLLENMPQVLISSLFAGIFYPRASAVLSTIWVVFRVVYAYGYIAGKDPKARLYGSPYYIGQAGLWGLCVYAAITKLL